MSICNPCTPVNTIPSCVTNIIIGTIASVSTAVYVYIKNISTGKVTRISATSSIAGLVTAVLGDFIPMDNCSYEIWVTLATADIDTKLNVTISAVAYTCFAVRFETITTTADVVVSVTNYTLKVAA